MGTTKMEKQLNTIIELLKKNEPKEYNIVVGKETSIEFPKQSTPINKWYETNSPTMQFILNRIKECSKDSDCGECRYMYDCDVIKTYINNILIDEKEIDSTKETSIINDDGTYWHDDIKRVMEECGGENEDRCTECKYASLCDEVEKQMRENGVIVDE